MNECLDACDTTIWFGFLHCRSGVIPMYIQNSNKQAAATTAAERQHDRKQVNVRGREGAAIQQFTSNAALLFPFAMEQCKRFELRLVIFCSEVKGAQSGGRCALSLFELRALSCIAYNQNFLCAYFSACDAMRMFSSL